MPYAKHWAFTVHLNHLINHQSVEEWFEFAKTKTTGLKYLVMQLEVAPQNGTIHVQGFLTSQAKKRESGLGNIFMCLPTVFQLMMRNSTPFANKVYCTKDDTRKPGTQPFEYGEVPNEVAKGKSKLDAFVDKLKEEGLDKAIDADPSTYIRNCNGIRDYAKHLRRQQLAARTERDVHVIVVWGDSGCGKSWWANHFDPGFSYVLPDVMHGQRLNLDGYGGERTLIIEDYEGAIEFRTFLRLLDIYNADFNTKGSTVSADWNYVLITSNSHPETWYPNSKDDWNVAAKAPLKRRIETIIKGEGNALMSTKLFRFEDGVTMTELPTLEDLLLSQETPQGTPASTPPNPTEDLATFGGLVPNLSVEDEILEDLAEQQEREDNTFGGLSPIVSLDDPEIHNILFGEGEPEPQGFDIQ